jgi:predicted NBD/HSP70 family sugar kinase
VVSILVNFFNPEQVGIGGGVVHSGPMFLTIVERVVRERCLDLATEQLRVLHGRDDPLEGVIGAGSMVVDGLLSPGFLFAWANTGTPYDVESIVANGR